MTKKDVFTLSNFGVAGGRTASRVAIEGGIIDAFRRYGYSEVTLPTYEFYDNLKSVTHGFRDENIITFLDRNSGKTMVLRPDFTPQVCRMIAGYYYNYPTPIRLCYRGSVFRNVDAHDGEKAEIFQIGCELYGAGEYDGDLELLLCLKQTLRSAEVCNYKISLCDAAYVDRVKMLIVNHMADKPLEEASAYLLAYFDALAHKNLDLLQEIVLSVAFPDVLKRFLLALPMGFGSVECVAEFKELSKFDAVLASRCEYIGELLSALVEFGYNSADLVFDFSEVKDLNYYTGISFTVLDAVSGMPLGGGGRYDNLMKKFGHELTACGMGLSVSALEQCADKAIDDIVYDWVVVGRDNLYKAEELRGGGDSVFYIADVRDFERYIKIIKYKKIIAAV